MWHPVKFMSLSKCQCSVNDDHSTLICSLISTAVSLGSLWAAPGCSIWSHSVLIGWLGFNSTFSTYRLHHANPEGCFLTVSCLLWIVSFCCTILFRYCLLPEYVNLAECVWSVLQWLRWHHQSNVGQGSWDQQSAHCKDTGGKLDSAVPRTAGRAARSRPQLWKFPFH